MSLHNVPVFGSLILFFGVIISYTVSVSLGHVYYWFPYISDTGAEPPEDGIFGFVLNVSCVLFIISMIIRYLQIQCIKNKMMMNFSRYWNISALVFGLLSCFGMNIVANFSEMAMGTSHLVGAFTCFTSAIVYFLLQTKISYHFLHHESQFAIGKALFICRFALCLAIITFFFLTLWFGKLAIAQFTGSKLNYWTPNMGGIQYRLISTFSEWTILICIATYILTFSVEFRNVECDGIAVRIKSS